MADWYNLLELNRRSSSHNKKIIALALAGVVGLIFLANATEHLWGSPGAPATVDASSPNRMSDGLLQRPLRDQLARINAALVDGGGDRCEPTGRLMYLGATDDGGMGFWSMGCRQGDLMVSLTDLPDGGAQAATVPCRLAANAGNVQCWRRLDQQ